MSRGRAAGGYGWGGNRGGARQILATPVSALDGSVLRIDEDVEYAGIEFGPEQLVARVPVEWASEYEGTLLAPLPATLAASLPEEDELVVETGS